MNEPRKPDDWGASRGLDYLETDKAVDAKRVGIEGVSRYGKAALCAPRLTFISYGIPNKGDAKWLDQRGSFMAVVAAGPVFRLLGAKDLGTSDDYLKEPLPAVNHGLLDGHLAWRQHDGGHTDAPNIEHFIRWADTHFKK